MGVRSPALLWMGAGASGREKMGKVPYFCWGLDADSTWQSLMLALARGRTVGSITSDRDPVFTSVPCGPAAPPGLSLTATFRSSSTAVFRPKTNGGGQEGKGVAGRRPVTWPVPLTRSSGRGWFCFGPDHKLTQLHSTQTGLSPFSLMQTVTRDLQPAGCLQPLSVRPGCSISCLLAPLSFLCAGWPAASAR